MKLVLAWPGVEEVHVGVVQRELDEDGARPHVVGRSSSQVLKVSHGR